MKRREFLKAGVGLGAATFALGPGQVLDSLKTSQEKLTDIVVAKNGSPAALVQNAIKSLGGMSQFVTKGDVVVVKPNIGWDRTPQQAANTNPEVVAETIRLCYEAGAKKVKVFDRTCNDARRCYKRSGIEEAVKEAGGEIRHIVEARFTKIDIPQGKVLKSWEFYKDVLECDVLINIPVAKHHSLTRVSLGVKNIMGVIGGDRGEIHNGIDQKLADLCTILQPHLTVLDATRILVANGPQGGSLGDVRQTSTIAAGTDMITVDAYAATLFQLKGSDIGYIARCHEMGLGVMDLEKVNIKEIDLG
ncbi:MAG: DUF362 domain-containing protein [Gemmatimonadota bacterium]|nr:MAG: DUF362 domain-containing protein [Gemmatimonadota bacterium]